MPTLSNWSFVLTNYVYNYISHAYFIKLAVCFNKLHITTLVIYDVAHSFPLGGVGRDFSFTEDETPKAFLIPLRYF